MRSKKRGQCSWGSAAGRGHEAPVASMHMCNGHCKAEVKLGCADRGRACHVGQEWCMHHVGSYRAEVLHFAGISRQEISKNKVDRNRGKCVAKGGGTGSLLRAWLCVFGSCKEVVLHGDNKRGRWCGSG